MPPQLLVHHGNATISRGAAKSCKKLESNRIMWWPDSLPKDILPNGHFADGRSAERTFCRTDILPNGQFAERRVCRTESLPKIEISFKLYRFAYTVKISVIKVIVDFDDRNFDSEV
jgi:hypothetical protein